MRQSTNDNDYQVHTPCSNPLQSQSTDLFVDALEYEPDEYHTIEFECHEDSRMIHTAVAKGKDKASGNQTKTKDKRKSIQWCHPNVVTHVWYRPVTCPQDKHILHYNAMELLRFRNEYKDTVTQAYYQRVRALHNQTHNHESQATYHNHVNVNANAKDPIWNAWLLVCPIKELITMFSQFMFYGEDIPLLQKKQAHKAAPSHEATASILRSNTIASTAGMTPRHRTDGLTSDTNVLIDTLYLF